MGKPVNITLSVQAQDLYNAYPQPANQTQLDTYCALSDNNNGGIGQGGTLNDFTSQVYHNQLVTWLIRNGQGGPYQVKIMSITNSSTPPFFSPNTISGGVNGAASVNGTPIVTSGEDTYNIHFRVTKTSQPSGHKDYPLDPKLGGNP